MGDVSTSERETWAQRDGSTQVVAETCLKTRKAEAMGLGLGALTCGYRIVRYPISSGVKPTLFEYIVPGRERQVGVVSTIAGQNVMVWSGEQGERSSNKPDTALWEIANLLSRCNSTDSSAGSC